MQYVPNRIDTSDNETKVQHVGSTASMDTPSIYKMEKPRFPF